MMKVYMIYINISVVILVLLWKFRMIMEEVNMKVWINIQKIKMK
jgi:hypothetical protein